MTKQDDKSSEDSRALAFRQELHKFFKLAEKTESPELDITAGQLHRAVSGYPTHLILCCEVMPEEMAPGDSVRYEPHAGLHGSLTIRYVLPRRKEK